MWEKFFLGEGAGLTTAHPSTQSSQPPNPKILLPTFLATQDCIYNHNFNLFYIELLFLYRVKGGEAARTNAEEVLPKFYFV